MNPVLRKTRMICIFKNLNSGLAEISNTYPGHSFAGNIPPSTGFHRGAKGVMAGTFDDFSK